MLNILYKNKGNKIVQNCIPSLFLFISDGWLVLVEHPVICSVYSVKLLHLRTLWTSRFKVSLCFSSSLFRAIITEQSGINPIKSPAMMLRLVEVAPGFCTSSHLLTHSHCSRVMVRRETCGFEAIKHRSAVKFRPATKKPSVHEGERTFFNFQI